MHNAAIRVEWEPNHFKQVDEAKKKYLAAKAQNRTITDLHGTELERFLPHLGGFCIKEVSLLASHFAFRIFDDSGDRRIIWNASDPHQIKEAANLFQSYIDKGWKPYAINAFGTRGKRVRRFDYLAEELVFDDESKQPLKTFGEKFREVKLMPRTYPG